MDPQYHALLLDHATAEHDARMDHYQMRIPAGTTIGGAVVELSVDGRGIITAGLRIPGPPAP